MPIVLSQSWEATAISSVGAKMPPVKARAWEQTSGRFVFKHRRSGHHLRQIESLYARMLDAVRSSLRIAEPEEQDFSSYSGPLLEELYYNLDGFFEAMRSSHDASLSCLNSADLLRNAPNSLHDFFKKRERLLNGSRTNDVSMVELLVSFWEETGRVAKDHRDCLSHYVSLSGPTWQHSANTVWKQGTWTLSVRLPDNPEAYKYSALSFASRLDALDVCKKFHEETEQLVRAILTRSMEHWHVGHIDTSAFAMTIANVAIGK
ncbi:hypothetical protein LP416_27765 [Polaromonas sp. P2-4]|nr:hypothetical protein LP416_27765 [Polaromonas sp. P2-4]